MSEASIFIAFALTDEQDQRLAYSLFVDAPSPFVLIDHSSEHSEQITKFVDGRGLACPQPLLKTKKALKQHGASRFLYLVANDPHSLADIHAFSTQSGLRCHSWQTSLDDRSHEKTYHFLLKNDNIGNETL